jgi:hypothetical protein
MLPFMHQLKHIVDTHDCILLVPVDPRTLGQRELALLERNTETIIPRGESEQPEEMVVGSGEEGVLKLLDVKHR